VTPARRDTLESVVDSDARSLFIVGLPRSMTSFIYHHARRALALREPAWTSDGEILNNDRFALYCGDTFDASEKYLWKDGTPRKFMAAVALAEQAVQTHGFIYKDVVNPFAIAAYLRTQDHPVLHIDRDPVEAAMVMSGMGWFYPARVAKRPDRSVEAVLEGLIRARQALCTVPRVTVRFADLLESEAPLRAALQQLYPNRTIPELRYIDGPFMARRSQLEALRRTPPYAELRGLQDALT
jgi:hypothetical protein